MPDKKKLREQLIRNNPNDTATKLLDKAKALKISNRKTDFLSEVRNIRKLPEPTKQKKEQSIPIIHRKVKPKVAKPKVAKPKPSITKVLKQKKIIPFAETKFGKITKDLQKTHNISEKNAIIHARKILKVDKSDYDKINQKDVQILLAHTP
jgi:hypothetical protein